MRESDTCPVCNGRVGRVDRRIHQGQAVLVYWHTELPENMEYCVEEPDGSMRTECSGELTGPRRRIPGC